MICQIAISSGQFHGAIAAMTAKGLALHFIAADLVFEDHFHGQVVSEAPGKADVAPASRPQCNLTRGSVLLTNEACDRSISQHAATLEVDIETAMQVPKGEITMRRVFAIEYVTHDGVMQSPEAVQ